MIDLALYRPNVFTAPAAVPDHEQGRSGGPNPREALAWRRSG
jgi:hypothetical protein